MTETFLQLYKLAIKHGVTIELMTPGDARYEHQAVIITLSKGRYHYRHFISVEDLTNTYADIINHVINNGITRIKELEEKKNES